MKFLATMGGAILLAWAASAMAAPTPSPVMAARVRAEFLHAWRNHRRYAWGHDELRPLSRTPRDWYGQSLLMTPVDALDTLIIMGLGREAAADRALDAFFPALLALSGDVGRAARLQDSSFAMWNLAGIERRSSTTRP
jgi:hypothetical protein